jgi:hypothetical protein
LEVSFFVSVKFTIVMGFGFDNSIWIFIIRNYCDGAINIAILKEHSGTATGVRVPTIPTYKLHELAS